MNINDVNEKIKIAFNSNIMQFLGDEKLSFEINEKLIPKIILFRKQVNKNIPTVRIFDTSEIPQDAFCIINEDEVFYEKALSDDEKTNLGDTIYKQLYILLSTKY